VTGPMTVKVRRIQRDDVDTVYLLWCQYGNEFMGPAMSFDRWGPGVAVPVEEAMSTDHIPPEPSIAVRRHLEQTVDNPQSACFVADRDGDIMGYATASWSSHPTLVGRTGTIEELYVQPDARRQGIGSLLVLHVLDYLRSMQAASFRAEAQLGDKRALAFFRALGWSTELALFSLYD
jgi:ribosomal protein S18 acetylase RimI-like enzyme